MIFEFLRFGSFTVYFSPNSSHVWVLSSSFELSNPKKGLRIEKTGNLFDEFLDTHMRLTTNFYGNLVTQKKSKIFWGFAPGPHLQWYSIFLLGHCGARALLIQFFRLRPGGKVLSSWNIFRSTSRWVGVWGKNVVILKGTTSGTIHIKLGKFRKYLGGRSGKYSKTVWWGGCLWKYIFSIHT